MLAHKRKELIKEMVDKYRTVRVSDLSERFQTSDVTIRRDLKELEEAGALIDVSHMPARVKCAVLGWHTLDAIIQGEES